MLLMFFFLCFSFPYPAVFDNGIGLLKVCVACILKKEKEEDEKKKKKERKILKHVLQESISFDGFSLTGSITSY